MDKESEPDTDVTSHPSPGDFDKFLPWACSQLYVDVDVVVTRKILSGYLGATASKSKGKPKSKAPSYSDTSSAHLNPDSKLAMEDKNESIVYVETVYDTNLNLIQIKFVKNKRIPRLIIKIITLIISFHTALSSISIDGGLDKENIYEISKLLPLSRITEICFDYTFLPEANYYILLGKNALKHLSLSKCKITDEVVKTIASNLVFPCPASKTLSILNLATNRITDLGVSYLVEALRSNRQLSYLNLADNMITDKGAISIFEILIVFPINDTEIMSKKGRNLIYLKKKNELILKTFKELHAADFDKRTNRRRSNKPQTAPLVKKKMLDSDSLAGETSKSVPTMDVYQYERAENIAESLMGPFEDPFSLTNTEIRDGTVYCFGNNSLCYLNLAYNNLSFICLNKLCEVLNTQKFLNRKPKGLINVIIEGNCLPVTCTELHQINDLLESGFENIRRMSTAVKKKSSSSRTATSK